MAYRVHPRSGRPQEYASFSAAKTAADATRFSRGRALKWKATKHCAGEPCEWYADDCDAWIEKVGARKNPASKRYIEVGANVGDDVVAFLDRAGLPSDVVKYQSGKAILEVAGPYNRIVKALGAEGSYKTWEWFTTAKPNPKKNPRYASGPYAERVKLPGWSGKAALEHAPAPRIRAAFGSTDHEAALEKAIVHANAAARAYNRTMKEAIAKHGDPQPWVSGIGSESFPEATKKLLRRQLDAFNRAQDAANLHYKATGKRTPFYKSEYAHRLVKAGGYGLGSAKSNPAASNRWGVTFKKGDVVQDHRGYKFRYVKLAKSDGFSRAYGKQAIVCHDLTGPLTEDMEVGINDLRHVVKSNPKRNPRALHDVVQEQMHYYGQAPKAHDIFGVSISPFQSFGGGTGPRYWTAAVRAKGYEIGTLRVTQKGAGNYQGVFTPSRYSVKDGMAMQRGYGSSVTLSGTSKEKVKAQVLSALEHGLKRTRQGSGAPRTRQNPAKYTLAPNPGGGVVIRKDGREIGTASKGGMMHGMQLIDYLPRNGYKLIKADGGVNLPRNLFPQIKAALGVA